MTLLPHPTTPCYRQLGWYPRSHRYRAQGGSVSGLARQTVPPAHLGLQALQTRKWPLSRTLPPPATVSWGGTLGPTNTEPRGARFPVSRAKPPPSAHLELQALQAREWPLSRTLPTPATVSWGGTPGPTDTEPRGLGFRSRASNHPPLRISGSRPSGPANDSSPAPYHPTLPSAGVVPQVPPIPSPGGSVSGLARQTAPLCASRAPGPPGPQMAPLLHPTTPRYRQLGWYPGPTDTEPRGAGFLVSRAKPPRLTHTGLEAPALWHVTRSLSIRHPPMGF
jgi:hypothetical protein